MKKFINGKYIELTEEERSKSQNFFNNHNRFSVNRVSNNNKVNYEERIEALEKRVAELEAKLNSANESAEEPNA